MTNDFYVSRISKYEVSFSKIVVVDAIDETKSIETAIVIN